MKNTLTHKIIVILASSFLFCRFAMAAQDPNYNNLINGQYANVIRLKQVGGSYLGHNYKITSSQDDWVLVLGQYVGMFSHHYVNFSGYWIYNPSADYCWQASNNKNGPLVNWNQDGLAAGDPEDWEIFNFIPVDPSLNTVCIQVVGPLTTTTGNYVQLVGDRFLCQQPSKGNATVFTVEFVPNQVEVARVAVNRANQKEKMAKLAAQAAAQALVRANRPPQKNAR